MSTVVTLVSDDATGGSTYATTVRAYATLAIAETRSMHTVATLVCDDATGVSSYATNSE